MEPTQRVKQLLIDIQEDRKRYIALEKLLIKQRELMIGHTLATSKITTMACCLPNKSPCYLH